jgi:hypothetical protein
MANRDALPGYFALSLNPCIMISSRGDKTLGRITGIDKIYRIKYGL